jgi:hypothetical protein
MYYIGLDIHKKTISYCVKDAAGCVHREGKIGSSRRELDAWVRTLPQPRMMAMEALQARVRPGQLAGTGSTAEGAAAAVAHCAWSWLTWALEIGDYTRFSSNRQAISYCGLCADEKSSADKVMRMPPSKQRNKHIQRVLVEAAKLAPRLSPELAMIRARELERGNPNRATLAVARKMVCYMLAVERRQQDFVQTAAA